MKFRLFVLVVFLVAGCAQAGDPPSGDKVQPSGQLQASELPAPLRALDDKGVHLTREMPAPDGYRGYVGEYRGQPLPVYLLPDGKHAMVGSLYDGEGHDLTTQPMRESMAPVMDDTQWKQLEHATWIAEGAENPQRIVYAFTDTECPYCNKLWLASQAFLPSGKVQVRQVIVAVIAPQSMPRAAAILSAKDPAAALRRHEKAFDHSPIAADGPVSDEWRTKLDANGALMTQLGVFGTPALVYKDAKGKVRMVHGFPDADTLQAVFGN